MKTIQIRTEIPGPKSRALMSRREAAVPRGAYHATPVFAAKAEGAVIEDVDGNRFLDFAGGIGSLNVGHRAPHVLAAIREQLDRYLHLCFSVTPYESYVAVAEKLNALAPGKFAKKTFIVNTGAEAVENAIKIARAYTKRPAVICFEDAFHGRTLLTMSLTSKTHPYKAGFAPFASDIYRIPYAYVYRGEKGATAESFANHLEDAFKRVVGPESVAAVIAEPVLGEGGFVVPPRDYFRILHGICRKHGIVFIADEVQSGIARTGKWFASEHFGIEPDLITTAKSLGGGLPIAAVTGRAEIMCRASPPWRCSKRSRRKVCLPAPRPSASNSKSAPADGKRNGRSSAKCGGLAACAPSNLSATRKRANPPKSKRKKSRSFVTSTASSQSQRALTTTLFEFWHRW